jgi:AraC-like DNA-binding protein
VLEYSTLIERIPEPVPGPTIRADFHTQLVIHDGLVVVEVDFVEHACHAGSVLWVRPGQVFRPGAAGSVGATVCLFTVAFLPTPDGDRSVAPEEPTRWVLTETDAYEVSTIFELMLVEYRRTAESSRAILRNLLLAALGCLDRAEAVEPSPYPRPIDPRYLRFRSDLEKWFASTRRAEDYAERLGYSTRTLARICQDSTGIPVGQIIDARVVLEARRMLAHTNDTVAVIASRLGFSEPTNFVKYFVDTLEPHRTASDGCGDNPSTPLGCSEFPA